MAYQGPNLIRTHLRTSNEAYLYQDFLRSELSVAAFSRDTAALRKALAAPRSDVNAWNRHFGPPLYAAVYIRDVAITSLLLKHHANPNIRGYYGTPLIMAVWNRDEELVRLLLQSDKLDPNMRDRRGVTALWLSCAEGCPEIVRLLLSHKDTDPNLTHLDLTPLACATKRGHGLAAQYLLRRKDVTVELKREEDICPLALATKDGHTKILQLLLKRLPVGARDYGNCLQSLLLYAALTGSVATVQTLLERPDINPNFRDERYCTALCLAINRRHHAVVQCLLQRQDLDPNMQSRSALWPALFDCDGPALGLMLGIDSMEPNLGVLTPLSWAAKLGDEQLVGMLLARADVDVNMEFKPYGTPAILASQWGNEEVIQLLLKHDGLDLSVKDGYGYTTLDYAQDGCHDGIVRLLFEHRASD